jgi:hypothetical protein
LSYLEILEEKKSATLSPDTSRTNSHGGRTKMHFLLASIEVRVQQRSSSPTVLFNRQIFAMRKVFKKKGYVTWNTQLYFKCYLEDQEKQMTSSTIQKIMWGGINGYTYLTITNCWIVSSISQKQASQGISSILI